MNQIISTNDGLYLELTNNGEVVNVYIDDVQIPLLQEKGGMYFLEIDNQNPNKNPSIIPNGSFEIGTTKPDNWNLQTEYSNTPIWDNTIYHTGTKSIKVSISGTTDQISGYPESYKMQVEPNTYYMLSAWVKGENLGGTNGPASRGA